MDEVVGLVVPRGGSDFDNSNSYELRIAHFMSKRRAKTTFVGVLPDDAMTLDARIPSMVSEGECVVLTQRCCVEDADERLRAMKQMLDEAALSSDFVGLIRRSDAAPAPDRVVAILSKESAPPIASAPDSFKVIAIMAVYNEADIIESTIRYLASQGVGTYLIDNWSTDGTYEAASAMRGEGLLGIERFPSTGPTNFFCYRDILVRQQTLASELEADWFIRYDADERRRSPWAGVDLRDALYHVDTLGYSAVDHTQLTFHPVDNLFSPGAELEEHFRFFQFEEAGWAFAHVKAWRKTAHLVDLVSCAGHDAQFPGRRVFPYKFLLKHYPVRSQSHGLRKVVRERKGRFDPRLRALGWHVHYDHIDSQHRFVRDPIDLIEYEDHRFCTYHLAERLTGVGIGGFKGVGDLSASRERNSVAAVLLATSDAAEDARTVFELAAEEPPVPLYSVRGAAMGHDAALPELVPIERVLASSDSWESLVNAGLGRAFGSGRNVACAVLSVPLRSSPGLVRRLADSAFAADLPALVCPLSDRLGDGRVPARAMPASTYRPRDRDHVACSIDPSCLLMTREAWELTGEFKDLTSVRDSLGTAIDYAVRARQAGGRLLVTERAYINKLLDPNAASSASADFASIAEGLRTKHGDAWRDILYHGPGARSSRRNSSSRCAEKRLVMTTPYHEDANLLIRSIRHHLGQGVDLLLVAGPSQCVKGSDVLADYQAAGVVVLDESLDPSSVDLANLMAEAACDRFGAQMIFHCEPDEFWTSRTGDIGIELQRSNVDYILCPAFRTLLANKGKQTSYLRDTQLVVTCAQRDFPTAGGSQLLHPLVQRCLFSAKEGVPRFGQPLPGPLEPLLNGHVSDEIVVLKFPIRDWRSFMNDVVRFGGGAGGATTFFRDTGLDWPALYDSYLQGKLQRDFLGLLVRDQTAAELIGRGFCTSYGDFVRSFTRGVPTGLPGFGF